MRGFTLRALPVCFAVFACGCFFTQNNPFTTGLAKDTRPSSPTAACWQRVDTILAQKPETTDMPGLVKLVRAQTLSLSDLNTENVDASLVAAIEEIVKCEEEVLRRADMVNNDPEVLKRSEPMARAFADANKKASEAKKRLKALQPALNSRYGGIVPMNN